MKKKGSYCVLFIFRIDVIGKCKMLRKDVQFAKK